MRSAAIVVAAGRGTRLGAAIPKAFVALRGIPVVEYSLRTLAAVQDVAGIILVVSAAAETHAAAVVRRCAPHPPIQLVHGGAERQDSVAAGLAWVPADAELVIVHDAARPFVTAEQITACVAAAARHGAAILAVPAHDTVKLVEPDGTIVTTVDRQTVWLAQTPQVFRTALLRAAYDKAAQERFAGTDEAMLVERLGAGVHVVRGSDANRKITSPDDLRWAEWYAASR